MSKASQLDEGGLKAPPGLSRLGKIWWWFDFLVLVKLARLRFIAVLLAIGGVIAYWDTLKAYYDRWNRPAAESVQAAPDLEFWCPMHPTVIRDRPDKCPICAMPLSKRKKGDPSEDDVLPAGVIARVQLMPYRVALAGIQTSAIEYRPLAKEIRAVGFVEFDERKLQRITARVPGKNRLDKLHVNVTGQMVHEGAPLAELYAPDLVVTLQNLIDARRNGNTELERITRDRLRLWGIEADQIADILKSGKLPTHVTIRSPLSGHIIRKYQVEGEYVEEGARLFDVVDLSTVWIEAQVYEEELAFLSEGIEVVATTKAYPGRTYRGKIAFVHPHLDSATRTLRVRFDMPNARHELRPGMYANIRLEVPMTRLEFLRSARDERWRNQVVAEAAIGAAVGSIGPTGVGSLVQAAVGDVMARRGLVLAVPENAVIDTGSRRVVYREAEPGLYEGVLVELGPRSGGFYPVMGGLDAGDKVATAGAFLIDAETRLTGGVGSTYFGASGGPTGEKRSGAAVRPTSSGDEGARIKAALARLGPDDLKLAEAQKFCPVLKGRLGSMGKPVKLALKGRPVFLCCKGCESEAKANPDRILETVDRFRAGQTPGSAPSAADPEEAEIRANLAELRAEDRKVAELQGFCVIQQKSRLGSMGVPEKIVVNGHLVFLCCKGCEEDARKNLTSTLATVQKLRAQKSGHPGH